MMVFAMSCTKPDEPNNGGNNNGQNDSIVNPNNSGGNNSGQNDSIVDPNNSGGNSGNNNSDVYVTTYIPQDITRTTAVCGGDVATTQGLSLSELGVCWSTEHNPTFDDAHICTTVWNEPLVYTVTGLEPGTTYHVRAYAVLGLEYYYGEDKSFTTQSSGNGTFNGHDYIDLGLPSGILWATCNVGATMPEEYGNYFAWGETQQKDFYWWNTYQHSNGEGWNPPLTKYCDADNLTVLLPEDDAATANWGSGWRMPTKEEWQELLDNTTLSWNWTTQNWQNQINGLIITATNGSTLFLPLAGLYTEDYIGNPGNTGFYWSSSLDTDSPHGAWFFQFDGSGCNMYGYYPRYLGRSVRPVRSAKQVQIM